MGNKAVEKMTTVRGFFVNPRKVPVKEVIYHPSCNI